MNSLRPNNELIFKHWKNGIKLIRPEFTLKNPIEAHPHSLHQLFTLPFSVYFDNGDHQVQKLNEECAKVCGFESIPDAIGRSVFDFATKESAMRSIYNQKEIMKTEKIRIIEDCLVTKDEQLIPFLGISFPWYSQENKVIGVFGCSLVFNQHSIAAGLSQLYPLGLMSKKSSYEPFSLESNIIDRVYYTPREIQCIHFIMQGKSPREITKILHRSYRTIEHYIANIKNKMGVSTKAELIVKMNEWIIKSQEG